MSKELNLKLQAIGILKKDSANVYITIYDKFSRGLKQLEHFSHIRFFWYRGAVLKNPIGLSTEAIKKIENTRICLEKSDLSDGTVIFDIKPYLPIDDTVKDPRSLTIKKTKDFLSEYNQSQPSNEDVINIVPIGYFRIKGKKKYLEILPEHLGELNDLKKVSHLNVVWYFHRLDTAFARKTLLCNPPYEAPKTGVFACRAPVRPNPLALSVCRIIDLDEKKGLVEISSNDALNGTPLIHLKPYLAIDDRVEKAQVPEWISHWPRFLEDEENHNKTLSIKPAEVYTLKHYSPGTGPDKTSRSADKKKMPRTRSKDIIVYGARQHNLKNINVSIPLEKFTVVTGVSGSGKSSLAFDTLYAESQRQYMQSLSGSSHSVLEKPDFDSIENLLPALAIEQKNTAKNPRSTVGSISDIYSYLRLLFSRIGTRHCSKCGREILKVSAEALAKLITQLHEKTEISLFPGKKTGKTYSSFIIEQGIDSGKAFFQKIKSCIVDFYKTGKGFITLEINESEQLCVTERDACTSCSAVYFKMSPSIFSYNSPEGMCSGCNGLGFKMEVDIDKLIPFPERSLLDNASPWFGDLRKHMKKPNANWMRSEILALAQKKNVDLETPWKELPQDFRDIALFGSGDEKFVFTYKSEKTGRSGTIERPIGGAVNHLHRLYKNSSSGNSHELYKVFLSKTKCPDCEGERLSFQGRYVTLLGKRYPEVASMSIAAALEWVSSLKKELSDSSLKIAESIIDDLSSRLRALSDIELPYLSLDRPVTTLSGGEVQRIRLAGQLSCELSGLLYILDEPSTGLHPRDHEKLINIITKIRDSGNTVLVVEHDKDTMLAADYLIDMGPGAGKKGGEIIAQGFRDDVIKNVHSVTGKYLKTKTDLKIKVEREKQSPGFLVLEQASLHNLKNVSVKIPLARMTCVTGVSGSGKSSLIQGVLVPAVQNKLKNRNVKPENYQSLKGLKFIDKIINVDQASIGRTSRSVPATYIGVFEEIRNVFAKTEGAKKRKLQASRFSFNDKKGQCSGCNGLGRIKIDMSFLPDVWTLCKECEGKRYNSEILDILYKDKTISDVLNMDAIEALDLFSDEEKIVPYLKTMSEVGLDYIKLGQSSSSLSTGEAQRLKLALELSKQETGSTLYILDEPTSGLHFSDIEKLLNVLAALCERGNTVIIIEHNLSVIKNAHWVIDLGPGGGDAGGLLVGQGSVKDLMKIKQSFTGQFLKNYI